MNLKHEIMELCSTKELDNRALDTVVPSVFSIFKPENSGGAQMAFDTLMIVLGFDLDKEKYLSGIVEGLSGFEIAEMATSLIGKEQYNHYKELVHLEYLASAQPLMRAMNETIEQSQDLIKQFEGANNTLKENLN